MSAGQTANILTAAQAEAMLGAVRAHLRTSYGNVSPGVAIKLKSDWLRATRLRMGYEKSQPRDKRMREAARQTEHTGVDMSLALMFGARLVQICLDDVEDHLCRQVDKPLDTPKDFVKMIIGELENLDRMIDPLRFELHVTAQPDRPSSNRLAPIQLRLDILDAELTHKLG